MASYGMNDVKNGQKIIVDGYPCTIVDTEYVKPGKGQAFTRVKYRNLKTGRTVEMTMKSTDSVDAADVMDTDMEFLYSDGEFWHFMDPSTHDQIAADANDRHAGRERHPQHGWTEPDCRTVDDPDLIGDALQRIERRIGELVRFHQCNRSCGAIEQALAGPFR